MQSFARATTDFRFLPEARASRRSCGGRRCAAYFADDASHPIGRCDREGGRLHPSLLHGAFTEQLDEEVGELQARLLLEFVLKEIAPSVYNAAIADAQIYLRDRVADLDGACFEPEFAYWPQNTAKRPRR
jgi:uncharacterized protein (DUF2164 family)